MGGGQKHKQADYTSPGTDAATHMSGEEENEEEALLLVTTKFSSGSCLRPSV